VQEDVSSRTAEYVALFRALETARPASERLFADPFARDFLTGRQRIAERVARLPLVGSLPERLIDRRWPGPRPSVVARTRMIDDALLAALDHGLDQLLLLGAGYDCRAYRLMGTGQVGVFEVDHPATQAVKRDVIRATVGHLPANVTFVGVDFNRDDLGEAARAAGFESGARTFTVWEGVVSYLEAEAVDSTMRWIREVSGRGSELVFTYVHRGILDGTSSFGGSAAWTGSVASVGEPFVFGFDPAELGAYLAERGWELTDDLSTTEALTRYGRPADGLPSFYRVARARPLPPEPAGQSGTRPP
jgi:methyltransferase (TIGR00027 family)